MSKNTLQSGQTLVTLLFFTVVAMIITGGAVSVILTNSLTAAKYEVGTMSYSIAESGAENALLRFLRDPSYSSEVLSIDGGTATIQITGSDPYTITSVGTLNTVSRTVQVIVTYTNNVLTITSWKELP